MQEVDVAAIFVWHEEGEEERREEEEERGKRKEERKEERGKEKRHRVKPFNHTETNTGGRKSRMDVRGWLEVRSMNNSSVLLTCAGEPQTPPKKKQ
ncbi:hypothetical protein EYF80_052657 [Liparis tanakae]|uniref:Uncharacterized protein n=1 Tax=Liparis tanakae TaxID=230148 RepID=A0A4Z2F9Z3_9TELE|nr:hypothetical protein EYF80_052657 [Liparis tanakae]